jgi:hypothetical protein
MAEDEFPTKFWFGVTDACTGCNHTKRAHGPLGCGATVNVYQGGMAYSGTSTSRTVAAPTLTQGALAYSYRCDCHRGNVPEVAS